MPRGGHNRKPTNLKQLEGNPGKRPLNTDEPQPDPIAPTCPSWLSETAKQEWARVAPELERLGLLTELDRAGLAGYCASYAEWCHAQEILQREGWTYKNSRGQIRPRPEAIISRHALDQMRKLGALFGMTPSDRGRMELPDVENTEFGRQLDARMRIKRR